MFTGFQQLTVSGSAVGLTVPAQGASHAHIQCESESVRFRGDGTDPTGSAGTLLSAGEVLILTHPDQVSRIKFIAVGSDAVLNVTYTRGEAGPIKTIPLAVIPDDEGG